MKESELLSVIIPVYNVRNYFEKCMESVLNQTYTNLEIILVDDGSKDGSEILCDKFAKMDTRVKVIHQENKGIGCVRNAGLSLATGDYICFADSDDYLCLNLFERLLNAVKDNDCDIAICGHYTDRNGVITVEEPVPEETLILNKNEAVAELIEDRMINNYLWDKIFKKGLFDGIEFPDERAYEDVAIMHILFFKATRICRIPDCLYYYRKWSGSISGHLESQEKWFRNCLDMVFAKTERYQYFKNSNECDLERRSLASLVPTIYEGIRLANIYGKKEICERYSTFLKGKSKEIKSNPYVRRKEKRLLYIYKNPLIFSLYYAFHKLKKSS